jgi:hypothetical protein
LRWRNDQASQAGLGLPGSGTEIVLTARQAYEPTREVTEFWDSTADPQASIDFWSWRQPATSDTYASDR